jgi:hypothetical protein
MRNTINTNNSRNGKVPYVKITTVKNINSKNTADFQPAHTGGKQYTR